MSSLNPFTHELDKFCPACISSSIHLMKAGGYQCDTCGFGWYYGDDGRMKVWFHVKPELQVRPLANSPSKPPHTEQNSTSNEDHE